MAWPAFAIVNVTGTFVRILGVRWIGSAFSEPILAFNGWIGDHRLVLTAITFGLTFLLSPAARRRGRGADRDARRARRRARGRGTRSRRAMMAA